MMYIICFKIMTNLVYVTPQHCITCKYCTKTSVAYIYITYLVFPFHAVVKLPVGSLAVLLGCVRHLVAGSLASPAVGCPVSVGRAPGPVADSPFLLLDLGTGLFLLLCDKSLLPFPKQL